MLIGKREYSIALINYMFQLFLMKIIISFISPLVAMAGVGNSGSVTLLMYGLIFIRFIVMMYSLKAYRISDMLLLICFYLIFVFNYILFPDTRQYLVNQEMILIYLMFIPISVIGVSKIDVWDDFFDIGIRYAYFGLIVAILIFMQGFVSRLNYMEFSYSLLVLGGVAAIRGSQKYKIVDIMCFILYIILIISYGARTPVLLLVCLFFIGVVFNENRSKTVFGFSLFLLVFAVLWNTGLLEKILIKFSSGTNSYVIMRFINGSFFVSNERTEIYSVAKEYMQNMGFEVNGFFGDRELAKSFGQPYIHNFAYEIILSFGWVIGSVLLGMFIYKIVKLMVVNSGTKRLVLIYSLLVLFCRYLVSGSFVMEWRFYIFLGIIAALSRGNKLKISIGRIKLTDRE